MIGGYDYQPININPPIEIWRFSVNIKTPLPRLVDEILCAIKTPLISREAREIFWEFFAPKNSILVKNLIYFWSEIGRFSDNIKTHPPRFQNRKKILLRPTCAPQAKKLTIKTHPIAREAREIFCEFLHLKTAFSQ